MFPNANFSNNLKITTESLEPTATPIPLPADPAPNGNTAATRSQRVEFPLVRSQHPGTVDLTAERVAELLDNEDVSAGR
jgi:hypothetical protein